MNRGVSSLIIQGRLNDIDIFLDDLKNGETLKKQAEDRYPAYGPADIYNIIKIVCEQAGQKLPRIYFAVLPEDYSEDQIKRSLGQGMKILNANKRDDKDRYVGMNEIINWMKEDRESSPDNEER